MTSKGARLNPFEHALKRPDTYIGSAKTSVTNGVWLFNDENESAVQKTIRYNPGLFNIAREIISNAIDNVWRSKVLCSDNLVKKIVISINKKSGEITVWNDGYCIPVHKEEYEYTDPRTKHKSVDSLYPAEVFFGDMFSGTNYDDKEVRKTSGRNGMGAKATNVFSKQFKVECANPEDKKVFTQIYRNNGTERDPPEVKIYKNKTGYTQISFIPDYDYFKYPGTVVEKIEEQKLEEGEFLLEEEESLEEELYYYGIDDHFISLMKLYAYEVSMITNVQVKFIVDDHETNIKVPSLEKYVRLFYPSNENNKLLSVISPNTGDECVLVETDFNDIEEQDYLSHISFVNGIKTKDGGVHVIAWRDTLISAFVRFFNARKTTKEKSTIKVAAKQVYPYLQMFIRCEADRPKFSSQTKDELTEIFDENGTSIDYLVFNSKKKKDKDEWNLVIENSIKKMMKWNFIASLEEKLLSKIDKSISRTEQTSKRVNDIRYDPANEAGPGKKNAGKCTLFISEGLSAKALVIRGISSIENGKDFNGAFAIRGKFMNVQTASLREINSNQEIKLLKNILNLKRGLDYSLEENFNTLSYGKICIITDADDDGIHIRGLLINFFYREYPVLIQRGCLTSFSTAVAAVWLGKKDKKLFYSNPEFKKWYEEQTPIQKNKIKNVDYYKGLGSIPPEDASDYFENPKVINYILNGDEEEFMDLGFSGGKTSDKRKIWIVKNMNSAINSSSEFQTNDICILSEPPENLSEEEFIIEDEISLKEKVVESCAANDENYVYEGPLTISTFVDKQLIIYHRMALRRALPGIWDGFKECQRKIFFAIRMRNYKKALDLEKIMGAVKEITSYHHGAPALLETIVKMAQGFVGRNNIPLFVNKGEFGTRSGVKGVGGDHAAPRYIATMEEEISRCIFSSLDDDLLVRLYEDNELVEYDFYMPVVPMLLINGAEGIGCGWSTTIPNYNPVDLVEWIRMWLNGKEKELAPLKPWFRGFKGTIDLIREEKEDKIIGWKSQGILEKCEKEWKGWWEVKELPIGLWTKPFEEWLVYLYDGTIPKDKKWKKNDVKYIKQIKDYSGANHVHYIFEPTKDFIPDINTPNNFSILQTKGSLKNMIAIDENNFPHKFDSPEEYMYIFCPRRLNFYQKRKNHLLKILNLDLAKASNKFRFVKGVVDKKLNLHKTDEELERILSSDMWKFDRLGSLSETKEPSFDYLLSMQMRSMTIAKLQELEKEREKIQKQIADIEIKTSKDLWIEDLDKFEVAYQKFLNTRCEEKEKKTKTVPKKKKK
jgi:DNA topoisomerase II